MRVIRFYSMDGSQLEVIAKYIFNGDTPPEDEKLKNTCACVVAGLDAMEDPYDTMNARLIGLDKDLADLGFTRVEVMCSEEYDNRSDHTYDVVFNIQPRTVTFIKFDVKETGDKDTPYMKALAEKVVLGSIIAG